jgi:nucleoid DNA-binding protein
MAAKKKAPAKKKPVPKKAPAKKTAAKKAATKKAAPVKKAPGIKDAMSKTQIVAELAEKTELSKKEINSVLEELGVVIERHVRKSAAGQFTLPGLMKVVVVRKPATKARKGINPFTGEETMFKAKPARNVVKVRPLKKLKDMAV